MEKRNSLCEWIPGSLLLAWSAFHKYILLSGNWYLMVYWIGWVRWYLKVPGVRLALAVSGSGCGGSPSVLDIAARHVDYTKCANDPHLHFRYIPIRFWPKVVEQSMCIIQKWDKIQSTVKKNNIWYQTLWQNASPLPLSTNHPISASR